MFNYFQLDASTKIWIRFFTWYFWTPNLCSMDESHSLPGTRHRGREPLLRMKFSVMKFLKPTWCEIKCAWKCPNTTLIESMDSIEVLPKCHKTFWYYRPNLTLAAMLLLEWLLPWNAFKMHVRLIWNVLTISGKILKSWLQQQHITYLCLAIGKIAGYGNWADHKDMSFWSISYSGWVKPGQQILQWLTMFAIGPFTLSREETVR